MSGHKKSAILPDAFLERIEALQQRAGDEDEHFTAWFAERIGVERTTIYGWTYRDVVPLYAMRALEHLERIAELEEELQEARTAREKIEFTRAARDRVVQEIYSDLRRVRPKVQHAVGSFMAGLEELEEAVRREAGGIAWDEEKLRREAAS